jgi:hypothetical protein
MRIKVESLITAEENDCKKVEVVFYINSRYYKEKCKENINKTIAIIQYKLSRWRSSTQ